ncbi:MAG: hypothetical protein ABSF54_19925 [Bryobacteraceae bacterium]
MLSNDDLIYDAEGKPFHLAGTRIFWDGGELVYDCPHFKRHRVPTRLLNDLDEIAEVADWAPFRNGPY